MLGDSLATDDPTGDDAFGVDFASGTGAGVGAGVGAAAAFWQHKYLLAASVTGDVGNVRFSKDT